MQKVLAAASIVLALGAGSTAFMPSVAGAGEQTCFEIYIPPRTITICLPI